MVNSRFAFAFKNIAVVAVMAALALPAVARAEEGEGGSSPFSLLNFEVNGAYLMQGEGKETTGGSVGTFDFGWRPEYKISDSLSIPVRLMFTMLKEAGAEGTADDVTYFSTGLTVGADYAIVPGIVAGVDLGVQDFDGGMKPVFGVRGQYKLGLAEDAILKLIDAVQVSYHMVSTDGTLHELRAGIVIRL